MKHIRVGGVLAQSSLKGKHCLVEATNNLIEDMETTQCRTLSGESGYCCNLRKQNRSHQNQHKTTSYSYQGYKIVKIKVRMYAMLLLNVVNYIAVKDLFFCLNLP